MVTGDPNYLPSLFPLVSKELDEGLYIWQRPKSTLINLAITNPSDKGGYYGKCSYVEEAHGPVVDYYGLLIYVSQVLNQISTSCETHGVWQLIW